MTEEPKSPIHLRIVENPKNTLVCLNHLPKVIVDPRLNQEAVPEPTLDAFGTGRVEKQWFEEGTNLENEVNRPENFDDLEEDAGYKPKTNNPRLLLLGSAISSGLVISLLGSYLLMSRYHPKFQAEQQELEERFIDPKAFVRTQKFGCRYIPNEGDTLGYIIASFNHNFGKSCGYISFDNIVKRSSNYNAKTDEYRITPGIKVFIRLEDKTCLKK